MTLKNSENNGTEEVGLVTPTPGHQTPVSPIYRQVSNIKRTLASYEIVDHPDAVATSPVGPAPITSSFST